MTNTNVPVADVEEPNQPRVGWQAAASRAVETSFMRRLLPTLSDSEAALFRSQGGPLASAPFVSIPWDRTCRLEPQPLRVLLLRRPRLPLSLTTRTCRCGRPLDVLGHHRSACAVVERLGRRGFPLENAAARCVGRLGEGCAPTPSFETWTLAPLTRLMHGGSKSWLMDCRCSGEPSLQLTRRWCVH